MSGQDPIYDPVTEDDAQVYVDMLLERQRIHGERGSDFYGDPGQRWSITLSGGEATLSGLVPARIVLELHRRGVDAEPEAPRALAEMLIFGAREDALVGDGWSLSFAESPDDGVLVGRGLVPLRYEVSLILSVVSEWFPDEMSVYWFTESLVAAEPVENQPGVIEVRIRAGGLRNFEANFLYGEPAWLDMVEGYAKSTLGRRWVVGPRPGRTIYLFEFGAAGSTNVIVLADGRSGDFYEAMSEAGDYLVEYAPGLVEYVNEEVAYEDFRTDPDFQERLAELDEDDDEERWALFDEFMTDMTDLGGEGRGPWVASWEWSMSDQEFGEDAKREIFPGMSRAVLLAGYVGWLQEDDPDWHLYIADALQ